MKGHNFLAITRLIPTYVGENKPYDIKPGEVRLINLDHIITIEAYREDHSILTVVSRGEDVPQQFFAWDSLAELRRKLE